MPEPACPGCGETAALRGRTVGDDIAITCEQCGAEWMRGEPRGKPRGRAGEAGELARWVNETFGSHPRRRDEAVDTLRRAAEYWTAQQWLTVDLIAELR